MNKDVQIVHCVVLFTVQYTATLLGRPACEQSIHQDNHIFSHAHYVQDKPNCLANQASE